MDQRHPNIMGGQRAKAISELEENYFSRQEGHSKVRKEHRPRHWKVEGSAHLESSEQSSSVRIQGWGQRVRRENAAHQPPACCLENTVGL